jgi:hypothetical protein
MLSVEGITSGYVEGIDIPKGCLVKVRRHYYWHNRPERCWKIYPFENYIWLPYSSSRQDLNGRQ